MVFANSQSRKVIRDLANEFGIDFEDYGFIMKGGRSPNPAFKTDKSTWSAELSKPLERVFSKLDSPVLFSDGVGMVVQKSSENKHVFPILRAADGAYSFNPTAAEFS